MPSDPERIYLEPHAEYYGRAEGRVWCEDDVWPIDDPDGPGGVEYVRADGVEELAADLMEARAQRDGLRALLGSVYRRLRDGRELSRSHMEALRICYDRRRSLAALAENPSEGVE